jgi:hypothetical protein
MGTRRAEFSWQLSRSDFRAVLRVEVWQLTQALQGRLRKDGAIFESVAS